MSRNVKRGFDPGDERIFSGGELNKLRCAGADLYYLLDRDYSIKSASRFVADHYLLSERQRLALVRSVSSSQSVWARKGKELTGSLEGLTVSIDGFNTVITLEVAFSGSTLLCCMDGTVRDLAQLRGTYSLIDKTDMAVVSIGKALEKKKVRQADFYLDAPVSNCGRLKERILTLLSPFGFDVHVYIVDNVDRVIEKLENVITGDAIILDNCISWVNLTRTAISDSIGEYPYVELMPPTESN